MPLPSGWRYLNDDEAAQERAAGNTDVKNTIIRDEDKAIANTVESGIDTSDQQKSMLRRGLEFAGRQAARVALPITIGRGLGAAGGLLASSPTAPETGGIGPVIGTVAGNLVGGITSAMAQDYLLNKYAESHPGGTIANFVRAGERDVREHPYLSQASQLVLGAPLAGGGRLGVELTKKGLKQALGQAAVQGGVEAGGELATEGKIDPTKVLISSAIGGGLSRTAPNVRNFERRMLAGRLPNRFVNEYAPELPVLKTTLLQKSAANPEEAAIMKAAGAANEKELTRITNQAATKEAVERLTNPELANKSAAESAEVIAGRPAEVKDVNAELKSFRAMEKQRDALVDLISQNPDATENQAVRDLIHNLDQNILQRRQDLLRRGQGKLLYGEVETAPAKIPVEGTAPPPLQAENMAVTPLESRAPELIKPVQNLKVGDTLEYQGQKATVIGFATSKEGKAIPRLRFESETGEGANVKKKVEPTSEERSFGVNPNVFEDLTTGLSKAIRPGLSRIANKYGELGTYFKKQYEKMRVDARKFIEPKQYDLNQALNRLSKSQRETVNTYLETKAEGGNLANIQLSPDEQFAVTTHDKLQNITAAERTGSGAPLVRTSEGLRPFQQIPNYVNISTPNKKFWAAVTSKNPAIKEAARKSFEDYYVSKGKTAAEANTAFNDLTTIVSGDTAPYVEYAQLRTPEGIGLPKEYRLRPLEALQRQINKQGMDLAWHQNMENDPRLGPELGYPTNGRDITYDKTKPKALSSDTDVRIAMKDYVGLIDKSAQNFETIDRLIKTGLVQTPTQIWNIGQSFAQLGRLAGVRDIPAIIQGLKGFYSKSAKETAILRGSVRAGRNVNYASAEDTNDLLNGAMDVMQHLTLTETLEQKHRTFFDIIGKLISENRLRHNNDKFFEFWGPNNWRQWNADKLTDYTATRVAESMAGGYSAEELPNWATRGGSNLRPFVSLARWAIGQSNRFIDEVLIPARKGEIKPLIGSITGGLLSAGLINWLKDELTKVKPRELTWEEWLKLPEGNKDTAYTLASKASTSGFAGVLGSLAYQLIAAKHGEAPVGFENPAISAGTETAQRIIQYINAVHNGDTDPVDGLTTLTKQLFIDRIQLARTLLNPPPNEGKREEMIAKRLNYLPPRNLDFSGRLSSPFGLAGLLKREDTTGIKRLVENRRAQMMPAPRVSTALKPPGYYRFIAEAQGEPAAEAAMQRDRELTARRRELFQQSLSK